MTKAKSTAAIASKIAEKLAEQNVGPAELAFVWPEIAPPEYIPEEQHDYRPGTTEEEESRYRRTNAMLARCMDEVAQVQSAIESTMQLLKGAGVPIGDLDNALGTAGKNARGKAHDPEKGRFWPSDAVRDHWRFFRGKAERLNQVRKMVAAKLK